MRRELAREVAESGISIRLACRVAGLPRGAFEEPTPAPDANAWLRQALHELATRKYFTKFGSPRMQAFLRAGGDVVNHKRLARIWKEEGLILPRRSPRKRRVGPPSTRSVSASAPNEVWTLDFIEEKTEFGQKVRIFTVVDEFTRKALCLRAEKKFRAVEVVETLSALMGTHGIPRYIRTDNGPEFISEWTREFLASRGVEMIFIEPGCPWENGFVESFHGKFRNECLDEEIFWSRAEVQVIIERWRNFYNDERPHSSLGNRTPSEIWRDFSSPSGEEGTTPRKGA